MQFWRLEIQGQGGGRVRGLIRDTYSTRRERTLFSQQCIGKTPSGISLHSMGAPSWPSHFLRPCLLNHHIVNTWLQTWNPNPPFTSLNSSCTGSAVVLPEQQCMLWEYLDVRHRIRNSPVQEILTFLYYWPNKYISESLIKFWPTLIKALLIHLGLITKSYAYEKLFGDSVSLISPV